MSLKVKLLCSFVLLVIGIGVVGLSGIFTNKRVVENYEHIANVNMVNILNLGELSHAIQEGQMLSEMLLIETDPEKIKTFKEEIGETIKGFDVTLADYRKQPMLADEEQKLNSFVDKWRAWVVEEKKFEEVLARSHDEARAYMSGPLLEKHEAIEDDLAALFDFHKTESARYTQNSREYSDFGNFLGILIASVVSCVGMGIGFVISNKLTRSLSVISQEVAGSAEETFTAGNQLSEASLDLSNGATTSAASLEETVASLEELSSITKINADRSQRATEISKVSESNVMRGASEIKELSDSMSRIAESSKKMQDILSVIDDIAFQTNLLALNASVEAARAGEQGKGFAVVAEAVRALAQRSAASAKDIAILIHDSDQKVSEGVNKADKSSIVLGEIVKSIKDVSALNNEIAEASRQQADGIEQITKAMTNLDHATQKNAASSEEVAASSEEMSARAEQLKNLAASLHGIVSGKRLSASESTLAS